MAIQHVIGDMFKSPHKLLVHGCNAQGVMGSGVAAIVRRDFPKAYEDYCDWYEELRVIAGPGDLPMGQVQFVDCGNKIIANAITQRFFGGPPTRYVSYDAVAKAMREIDMYCGANSLKTFAMPKIGAGLGGGDWNVIEAIVASEVHYATAYIYSLE